MDANSSVVLPKVRALLCFLLIGTLWIAVFVNSILGEQSVPSATIDLKGTVRDVSSGMPLSRVSITIDERRVSSDAEGRFLMPSLSIGRHYLTAEQAAYTFVGLDGGARSETNGLQLSVTVGMSPVILNMAPRPTVSGRVVDDLGRLVERAEIEAYRLFYNPAGERMLSPVSSLMRTDDRGEFKTNSLRPDDYVFEITKQLVSSSVYLPFYYPSPLDLQTPETAQVRLGEELRIGTVLLNSAPAAILNVSLVDGDNKEIGMNTILLIRRRGEAKIRSFFSSPNTAVRLAPGTYDIEGGISMLPPQSPAANGMALSRTTVQMGNQDQVLTLVISSGTRVAGRIVSIDENGVSKPFGGAQIRLNAKGFMASWQFRALSDSSGAFVFSSVPVGSYQLAVPVFGQDPGTPSMAPSEINSLPRRCVKEIVLDNVPLVHPEVEIRGKPIDLSVVLRMPETEVSGVVVDSNGVPSASAIIAVIRDGQQLDWSSGAVVSDHQGNFRFSCALPASYIAYAWANLPGPAYRNNEFMEHYRDQGQPLRVESSGTNTTRLTLLPR